MHGRVMALVYTMSGVGSLLGMAVVGVLGDAINKKFSAIYVGSGVLIGLMTLIAMSRQSLRNFLAFESS